MRRPPVFHWRWIALLTLALGPSAAWAQPNLAEQERVSIQRAVDHLHRQESDPAAKARLGQIKVVVDPRPGPQFAVAILRPNGAREIVVSVGFLAGLHEHTRAMFIGGHFGRRDLGLAYFEHRSNAMLYEHLRHVPLEVFAGLTQAQRQSIKVREANQTAEVAFGVAKLYVIAHEAAHHALDRFYDPSATPKSNRAMEAAMDGWAAERLLRMRMTPSVGATFASLYLDAVYEAPRAADAPVTHLPSLDRGLAVIAATRDRETRMSRHPPYNALRADQWEAMLHLFETQLGQRREARRTAALKARSAGGDAHASWMLSERYRRGYKATTSTTNALVFLRRAAAQGDAMAQYSLGRLLYMGDAQVGKDLLRARYWAEHATRAHLRLGAHLTQFVDRTPAGRRASCAVKRLFARDLMPFERCMAQREAGCMRACTGKHHLPERTCRERMCATPSQRAFAFGRCSSHLGAELDAQLGAADRACR